MRILLQCTGKVDTFAEGEEGISLARCIHWQPIEKRKHIEFVRNIAVAATIGLTLGMFLFLL